MSKPPLPPGPNKQYVQLLHAKANLRNTKTRESRPLILQLRSKKNVLKETKTREAKQREFKALTFEVKRDNQLNSLTYKFKDLDINFYDTNELENKVLIPVIQDARREGITSNADVHISITYSTAPANERYDRYLKKKSFNSFLLREYDTKFMDALYEYNINNVEASENGYERYIQYVVITIIQENGGGCYNGKTEKRTKVVESKRISPPSKNNNCLFFLCNNILDIYPLNRKRCNDIRAVFKLSKRISPPSKNNNCLFFLCNDILDIYPLNRKRCNDIRAVFKLDPDIFIPFSIAVEILNKYIKQGKTYEITNAITKETVRTNQDGEEPDKLIFLDDLHYYGLIKEFKKRCEDCLKLYLKKHTCSLNKKKYAGINLKKNSIRHLITKFHPEEKINNDQILHYDLETFKPREIADGYDTHKCYIVGYTQGGEGFQYIAGYNCINLFIDELIKRGELIKEGWQPKQVETKQKRKKNKKEEKPPVLYVNEFNGANFDHYFIKQALLSRGITPKASKINNGSIICLEFENVKMWDFKKHSQGSLKANLESMGCKILKGDFDHDQAKR